jgi:hypothetical protein
MRKPTVKRRPSPRRLITYTHFVGGDGKGGDLADFALGVSVLYAPDPLQHPRELLDGLKSEAVEVIADAGEDPSQWRELVRKREEADAPFVAAKLLAALERLDRHLSEIDRCTDAASLRLHAFDAIGETLAIAWQFSALRVVQHEKPIANQLDSVEFGRKAGVAKKVKYASRDIALAEEFERRRADPRYSRKSDTAIKEEIGSDPEVMKRLGMSKPLAPKGSRKAVDRGRMK